MENKEKLFSKLNTEFRKIMEKSGTVQTTVWEIYSKYNVPINLSSDYITLRSGIENADVNVLYYFTDYFFPEKITEYFSKTEIRKYKDKTYSVSKISFPLKYKMIEVTPNQYIGSITVKELMKLRDAQLIYYNENTQRTMQKNKRGDFVWWKIYTNNSAINAIKESFDNDTYIPNTITLNIPQDEENIFDYDGEELIIRKLDHFDILDGYHRYLAISKKHNDEPRWDYAMELRIVNFSTTKAQHFTWQEDQKTKMRRIDSESLNMNKAANIITTRLNGDAEFNLVGKLSRNKGIINSAEFAEAVHAVYTRDISKKQVTVESIKIAKELKDKINYLTENELSLLTKSWSRKQTAVIVWCCKNVKKEDMMTALKYFSTELEKEENNLIFSNSQIHQTDMARIEKMWRNRNV